MLTVAAPRAGVRRAVMFMPPIGEEMNKCRPMMTLQSRRLAERGVDSLLLDPFGTGDSAGDFGAGHFELWSDDLRRAFDFLCARGHETVDLVAIRSGALLVASLGAERLRRCRRMVLWQPTVKGSDYWRQIARMRQVAQSMRGGETPAPIEQEIEKAGGVEIAGYWYSQKLVSDLAEAVLHSTSAEAMKAVLWLDVVARADAGLSPASRRVVEQWRAVNVSVSAEAMTGEPFWATPEIAIVAGLVDRTSAFLTEALAELPAEMPAEMPSSAGS